jgi:hypothetical protein
MKKRVRGVVVVVVFLPFSLKTEKESSFWLLKGVLVVLSRRPKEKLLLPPLP